MEYKYNGLKSPLWSGLFSPLFSPFDGSAIAGGVGSASDPLLDAVLALSPIWLYDNKDITTFWADDARTVQASVGGVVAVQDDVSGNGWHRRQTDNTKRPILRQSGSLYYLEYDGSNDFMLTSSIDLSATDALTITMGVRKLSDAAIANVAENSAGGFNGTIRITAPSSAGTASATFMSRGTTSGTATVTNATWAAPKTFVATGLGDISTDTAILRLNGTQVASSAVDQGTGNYGNYAFYFGMRGGTLNPFTGYDYGGALFGSVLSGANLTAVEAFVADRTGVTL